MTLRRRPRWPRAVCYATSAQIALQGAAEGHCNVELIDLSEYDLYFCDGLEFQSKRAKVRRAMHPIMCVCVCKRRARGGGA